MTQSNSGRFNLGDLVELKSGGPKMTVGKAVTKKAQELRPTSTSVTTELIMAYHAVINAMIAAAPGGDAACSCCGATPAELVAVRSLRLEPEEFLKRLEETPGQGLSNGGLAGEVVYCEWFERGTLKRGFFPSEVLKRAREEEK